jgi:hypothetical protein
MIRPVLAVRGLPRGVVLLPLLKFVAPLAVLLEKVTTGVSIWFPVAAAPLRGIAVDAIALGRELANWKDVGETGMAK